MDKQKIDLDRDDLSQGLGDISALIFTEVLNLLNMMNM